MPALVAALKNSGSSVLLSTAEAVLSDERHENMAQCVDQVINDEAVGGLGKGPLAIRNARLFAVKSEHRQLLEVARATYLENIQDLSTLLNSIKEEYQLPSLTLHYTNNGYVFQANREARNLQCDNSCCFISREQEFDAQQPMPRVWMNVVRPSSPSHV